MRLRMNGQRRHLRWKVRQQRIQIGRTDRRSEIAAVVNGNRRTEKFEQRHARYGRGQGKLNDRCGEDNVQHEPTLGAARDISLKVFKPARGKKNVETKCDNRNEDAPGRFNRTQRPVPFSVTLQQRK